MGARAFHRPIRPSPFGHGQAVAYCIGACNVLAVLASLEELSLGGDTTSHVGLESLAAIERIKKLHLDGWNIAAIERAVLPSDDELLGSASSKLAPLAALQTLRRAKPGIAIDGNAYHEE